LQNLYKNILNEKVENIWLLALLYPILMLVNGFVWGYKDNIPVERKIGFQYHLLTYVIVNSLGVIWLLFLPSLGYSKFNIALIQISSWGIGLFFHWLFTNYRIAFTKI
jgi:uncharacterized protein involved in cysteine biosynthesis